MLLWDMSFVFANKVPPHARLAYRLDAISGIFVAVMSGLTGPFAGVIARKTLHASAFEIAVLTMAPCAACLLSLVWANVTEGKPKMPFALWSWIVSRSLLFPMAFCTGSISFVAVLSAMSFIGSMAGPAYSAIMKEVYPDGDRARIMGYVRVCSLATFVVVTAIAAPLLKDYNYRWVFPIGGVFGIASALAFGKIPTKLTDGDARVSLPQFVADGVMILKEDPGFRWLCLGVFLWGWGGFLVLPVYTIRQVEIGVNTDWAGVYSIIGALVMSVGFFYWGGYVDRVRPERCIAIQASLQTLVPLNYCVATSPWMLIPSTVVGGIVNAGGELSAFASVLYFAPKDRITQYQGIYLSLFGLRGILAPLMGAALLESKLLPQRSIFLLGMALTLVGVLVILAGMRRYDRLSVEGTGTRP